MNSLLAAPKRRAERVPVGSMPLPRGRSRSAPGLAAPVHDLLVHVLDDLADLQEVVGDQPLPLKRLVAQRRVGKHKEGHLEYQKQVYFYPLVTGRLEL